MLSAAGGIYGASSLGAGMWCCQEAGFADLLRTCALLSELPQTVVPQVMLQQPGGGLCFLHAAICQQQCVAAGPAMLGASIVEQYICHSM